jgi:hypothetical protein
MTREQWFDVLEVLAQHTYSAVEMNAAARTEETADHERFLREHSITIRSWDGTVIRVD